MAKDIETMSSKELKDAIFRTPGDTSDDGMQADSVGYSKEVEEEADEEQEPEEESLEEPEDPVTEYLERQAQEKLQRLSPAQKSTYRQVLKAAARQEEMEKANDFQEDAAEFASKYSAFPDVLEKFYADWRFGRLKFTPAERADFETSETPAEDMLFSWANKQKLPSDTLGGIIKTYHNGPKLKSRFRDRIAGFNKPRKRMTDKEIKETVDSILEE